MESLVKPLRLWSREDVLSRPCPVPKEPGVYAWYFKELPPGVPSINCVKSGDLTLLYIGIAPRPAPTNGKPPSKQRLCNRVRYHFKGNAEGSTLRLTLGCLLADRLGLRLRRVGSGARMTFGEGEQALSAWMHANAFVAWQVSQQPAIDEHRLIGNVSLPLNLAMNGAHPFHAELSAVRKAAKASAREQPFGQ